MEGTYLRSPNLRNIIIPKNGGKMSIYNLYIKSGIPRIGMLGITFKKNQPP